MISVTVAPSCWMDVVWRAAEKVIWPARTRECAKVGGGARERHTLLYNPRCRIVTNLDFIHFCNNSSIYLVTGLC